MLVPRSNGCARAARRAAARSRDGRRVVGRLEPTDAVRRRGARGRDEEPDRDRSGGRDARQCPTGHAVSAARSCSSRSARRARDAGADGADRGVADLGGLGVRAAEHLGQDEGGPAVGGRGRATSCVEADRRRRRAGASPPAWRVRAGRAAGAGAARRARSPRTRTRVIARSHVRPLGVGPEAGQRPVGAEEHVLGDVVGVVPADEVRGQPPDVGLRPADRGGRARRGRRLAPRPGGACSSSTSADVTGASRSTPEIGAREKFGNQRPPTRRLPPMDCERCREPPSPPALDGEDPGVADGVVRAHVDGVRARAGRSQPTRRRCTGPPGSPRPSPCPTSPTPILRAIGDRALVRRRSTSAPSSCASRSPSSRVIQLGMAVPALILGDDAGPPHPRRPPSRLVRAGTRRRAARRRLEAGAGGRGAARWSPRSSICLVGSSVLDIVQGRAAPGAEVSHAPELVGLVAVWLLARVPDRACTASAPSGAGIGPPRSWRRCGGIDACVAASGRGRGRSRS